MTTDNTQSKPDDPVSIMQAAPAGIKSIFASVLNLDNQDRFFEPSCPICSSKFRLDGEKLYKSFDKYAGNSRDDSVKDFFSHKGEMFSMDAIRHHMTRHMDRGDQELRKGEYLSRLDSINASKMSTMEMLDYATASVMERIIAQSELIPDGKYTRTDVEDMKTKNIGSLNKVLASILSLRADLLGEMKMSGEAIVIPRESFEKAFEEAFKKAKTKEETEIITFVLKKISSMEHK